MAPTIELKVEDAKELLEEVFTNAGYKCEDAVRISAHLIDAELRGYGVAGLSRALSVLEFIKAGIIKVGKTTVESRTASSASLDGHNGLGYVVAYEATQLAIDIARENGVAVVAAKNTASLHSTRMVGLCANLPLQIFTGMLSYWAEMATANDLVAVISSSTNACASPAGTTQALLGTNPFCIALPSSDIPIIYDIGTSSSTYGEIRMCQRVREKLRPGIAYDKAGNPTIDPDKAMEGIFSVRDGPVGLGLSIVVQLLGVAAGAPALPSPADGFGFVIMLFNPKLFGSVETYKSRIDEYVKVFTSAPRKDGQAPPRIPFARSYQAREAAGERGTFEVYAQVVEELEVFRNEKFAGAS